MSFTCDNCRQRQSLRQPHVTVTGRKLCDSCHARLIGATVGAAGALSQRGSSSDAVATGLATSSIYDSLRRWGRRLRRGLNRR